MKRIQIQATFPEIKGVNTRSGVGVASTTRAGIARAFEDVLKQVKGKRISVINASLSISETKNGQE